MSRWKKMGKAMRISLDNAKRFLQDSRILEKDGSLGHASSMAILGFEEAQKAFELTKFLPIYDDIISNEDRKELKGRLLDHSWKQLYAKQLLIGLEGLLKSGVVSDLEKSELGFPSLSELKDSTDSTLSENMNKMKNDGFYSNAFTNPAWDPSKVKLDRVKVLQKLLETQIKSVEKTVRWHSWIIRFIPPQIVGPAKAQLLEVLSTISEAESESITADELKTRLAKHGHVGKLVSGLVDSALSDERMKKLRKEKKKLRKRNEK